MQSDEVYGLLRSAAPCFSSVFVMTNMTHNSFPGNGKESIAYLQLVYLEKKIPANFGLKVIM